MNPARLNSRELCDLLNFVLGLPERIGKRTVLRSALSPCLVTGWRIKRRFRVEVWCDAQLMNAGVIPKVPRRAGRIPGRYVPPEVVALVKFWRAAA